MVEKKRLPREKVCFGMVLGVVARTLIQQEFGNLLSNGLCEPGSLLGEIFHVSDIGCQEVEDHTLLT